MKIAPFNYHAPASMQAALALRQELPGSEILAGGQSLVPYLAFRMRRCENLIDLNGVSELAGIREVNGRLEIGAMTRQRAIASLPLTMRITRWAIVCSARYKPARNVRAVSSTMSAITLPSDSSSSKAVRIKSFGASSSSSASRQLPCPHLPTMRRSYSGESLTFGICKGATVSQSAPVSSTELSTAILQLAS